MADKPITVNSANGYKNEYVSYMQNLGVNMNQQTQSVSFDAATLLHWLGTVAPNADEFRLFMGRYPQGHANAGRTTVIVWPYNNGQPATDGGIEIDPFNEGTGRP